MSGFDQYGACRTHGHHQCAVCLLELSQQKPAQLHAADEERTERRHRELVAVLERIAEAVLELAKRIKL